MYFCRKQREFLVANNILLVVSAFVVCWNDLALYRGNIF